MKKQIIEQMQEVASAESIKAMCKKVLEQIQVFDKYLDEEVKQDKEGYWKDNRIYLSIAYNGRKSESFINKELAHKFVKSIQDKIKQDIKDANKKFMIERKKLKEML